MKDENKTKKQLIDELMELRSQNATLKKSESPEKYRSQVKNIRDVIYELDSQGTVLYLRNPMKLLKKAVGPSLIPMWWMLFSPLRKSYWP